MDTIGRTIATPNSDYRRVLCRLVSFEDVPIPYALNAWTSLETWRLDVEKRTSLSLPAPYVFANDAGQIEFEWHVHDRELTLTLTPNGIHCYQVSETASEAESEGLVDASAIVNKVLWLLA